MAMQSDHDADDNINRFPAQCAKCGRGLGIHRTAQDAGDAEMNHWLQAHPVGGARDSEGRFTTADGGKSGKPAKLTRDQKRGKYPKPGKR
jgi:hypothetical protein